MQNDGTHDHQTLRDAVGHEGVLPQAAQQEDTQAAYRVVRYGGRHLPLGYVGFVHSRWKRSLRQGNDYFLLVRPGDYFDAYNRYLPRILESPECAVRLAVLADDPDVCVGFSVTRGKILDYVYVQSEFRRRGIAQHLVPKDIEVITHLTRTAMTIWGSKYKGWAFNPFA